MHSIGIIAAKVGKLIKLTGGLLTAGGSVSAAQRVTFFTNGTLALGPQSTAANVTGEWFQTVTTGIGSSYQARIVPETGAPTFSASDIGGAFVGGPNVWGSLSAQSFVAPFRGSATGRVRIEIRDSATSTLQASAQFWSSGFAP